ncbi:MAG: NUDIX domain-containing protein [Planctomycetota bacterium]
MPLSPDHELKLSKLLAYLLRHRPDSVGLELDPAGWVDLALLVERINQHGRLPFTLVVPDVAALVSGPSLELFERRGAQLRARTGHSVSGVAVEHGLEAPEYLFLSLEPDALDFYSGAQSLERPDGRPFVLHDDPDAAGEEHLVVVEAGRAARAGVSFDALEVPGGYTCARIPLRYVFGHRAGFLRQVSAGGVLARGAGEEIEFALIRTLPRAVAAGSGGLPMRDSSSEHMALERSDASHDALPRLDPDEAEDVAEGRTGEDRRRDSDRRQREEEPPDGVERRRGRSRRLHRRRRSGRYDAEGRLELPKGKLEPGETPAQAAVREAREEMGLVAELTVRATLSLNHYTFRTPDGQPVFKTVHYFLLECADYEPSFQPRLEEGIVSVEWWAGQRAIAQVAFPNLKPVLERAWELSQSS